MTKKIKKQIANWTTKSGQKMRICDMDDSHLLNTLNLVRRNAIINCLDDNYSKNTIKNGDWIHRVFNFGVFTCLRLESERRELEWDIDTFDYKTSLLFAETKNGVTIGSWGTSKELGNIRKKTIESKVNNKFGLLFFEGIKPIKEEKLEEDLEF